MYVLFVDEFGHEEGYDPSRPGRGYNPVFGYGGFLMPAGNISAFVTEFFDKKILAMRNVLLGKYVAWENYPSKRLPGGSLTRFQELADYFRTFTSNESLLADRKARFSCATYEVKGEHVFSRSYVTKMLERQAEGVTGSGENLRAFFRFARAFLKLLHKHDGEIFYFGVDKSRYPKNFPNPHLNFIRHVITKTYYIAQEKNSTIGVFLDHHHSDDIIYDTKQQPKGEGPVVFIRERRNRLTRAEKAREIILKDHLYGKITEPLTSFRSTESQCIQAADWVCYLLTQTFPFKCQRTRWQKYKPFHDRLEGQLFKKVASTSEFRFKSGISSGGRFQGELPFIT